MKPNPTPRIFLFDINDEDNNVSADRGKYEFIKKEDYDGLLKITQEQEAECVELRKYIKDYINNDNGAFDNDDRVKDLKKELEALRAENQTYRKEMDKITSALNRIGMLAKSGIGNGLEFNREVQNIVNTILDSKERWPY